MFKKYILHYIFRVTFFLYVLYLYLFQGELLSQIAFFRLHGPITPLHLIWAVFMVEMLMQILPGSHVSMGCLKQFKRNYTPVPHYDRAKLFDHVQTMNLRAIWVLLAWLGANAVFGLLYLAGILGVKDLVMLTLFYYVCDMTCVLFFCPFQRFFMKNRCCVTCRIFNWGHFMMFTPMLFIRSFFSWSLFFTSILLLIRWEYVYVKYPERFWEGSNQSLSCKNCHDKMCRIKKPFYEKRPVSSGSLERPD